jgi:hypothetical protein
MNIGKSSFTIKRRPCHSSVPHSHHNVLVGAKELVQMSQGNEQLPRIPRTRCLPQTKSTTNKMYQTHRKSVKQTIMYPMTYHSEGLFLGRNTQNSAWTISWHGNGKSTTHLSIQAVNMWRWAHVLKPKVQDDPFDFPRNGFWQFWVSVCQISGGQNCGNPAIHMNWNRIMPQIWLALAGATFGMTGKIHRELFPILWASDARTACKDMPLSFVYLEELLPNFRWTKKEIQNASDVFCFVNFEPYNCSML